jgi:hypothetical protein
MPYADPIKAKEYRLKNKDRQKFLTRRWYLANKELCLARSKKWAEENKQRSNEIKYKHIKQKIKKNVGYKLQRLLQRRITHALKGRAKITLTIDYIGCTTEELKKHIESKFTKGMSWDKMHLIHIDHIRPCASFDLSDPEQQRICFHYTNLQPLWAIDNLKKGAKLNYK